MASTIQFLEIYQVEPESFYRASAARPEPLHRLQDTRPRQTPSASLQDTRPRFAAAAEPEPFHRLQDTRPRQAPAAFQDTRPRFAAAAEPEPKKFNKEYQEDLKTRLQVHDIVNVKRYIMNKKTGMQILSTSIGKVAAINDNEFIISVKPPKSENSLNFTYKFRNVVSKDYTLPETPENKSDAYNLVQISSISKSGGNEMVDPYYIKYLKYKAKYAKLKESM
jgi:hypothetical protein